MQLRKFLALMLSALIACSCMSVSASANKVSSALADEITPFYQSVRNAENCLSITSGNAECTSICKGMSNVNSISVEHTLQKFWGLWIWNDVDGASWSAIEHGSSICLMTNKNGLTSGTYRLKSVFTLTTSSGQSETFTVYSEEVTI